MSLDKRGFQILMMLVNHPAISGAQLEKELNLSRKQISYSLQKINYYLNENGFEEIKRLKTGKFVISKDIIANYKVSENTYNEKEYVFEENERLKFIIMILLAHKEELSIQHFTNILKISKNTVINDMKKLQMNILDSYDLKLLYDRSKGYYIVGKEYEKRNLIIYLVRSILKSLNGKSMLVSVLEINEDVLNGFKSDVDKVESLLKVQYTDERIREIPYILYFLYLRIKAGKHLDVLPEDYQHIVGTKEYGIILKVFEKYRIENAMDKIFIVTQFQISSINYADGYDTSFELELFEAASKVLHNFENLVCITFKDRKSLLDALIQHLRPAMYRIRYHYHIEGKILNMILPQHSYLFELTRHAMQPFEEMIKSPFPEEELAYITILFGGWMTKEGTLEMVEKKRRAIVVCTNGVSISNFLFLKLQKAFPELEFICTLSSRQFYEFEQEFDAVFTTVLLDTDKSQFLVKPIMNENDVVTLRKKVFNELLNRSAYEVNSSSIIQVIEKYVDIKDYQGLKNSLKNYLGEENYSQNVVSNEKVSNDVGLVDLLTEDMIRVENTIEDWRVAIQLAAKPLLMQGAIEESYIEQMIRTIESDKPIWTIADGLILAHTGIDEGVNHLGMSLLKLDEAVIMNEYMEASIIVVIATPNKDVHLKALYALIEITEDDEILAQLKNAATKEELLSIISKERI